MTGPTIYVDADACPVKAEIYKVAERRGCSVVVVANRFIGVPRVSWIRLVVAGSGMDAADDIIAASVDRASIVVTSDVPLADRCIKAGAQVIAANGRAFTPSSIGLALATRNLLHDLRSSGDTTAGPRPFSSRDRSTFLQALDLAIVRLKRSEVRPGPGG